MKAVVLEKFATVGLPDSWTPKGGLNWGRSWSTVALSQHLIDQGLLTGLHRLNSRSLDLVVIGNENKIALLNLQAFKLFPSHLATSMIRQSLAHHFSEDGNLLFGIETSGDLFVLTDRLQSIKHIQKPSFIQLNPSYLPWYSRVSRTFSNMVGYLTAGNEMNQIVPENSQRIFLNSWLATSQKFNGIFPFLTALPDGFAILCALSPQDCFIFTTSYETALRQRSIGNVKGGNVPGKWHRILMDKTFIRLWLEEKEQPWFEGRLTTSSPEGIGGAMLYAVLEHTQFYLAYGIISSRDSHFRFRLSWEIIHYELDWAIREDNEAINLGSRFVARLSSDCGKAAVVINTHIGTYVHVEHLPSSSVQENPTKLPRRKMAFCPHGDYDGTHFFKRECWVSDIQWLAEDGYFAVMTQCGSLSIFHSSGSPMLIKTRLAGGGNPHDGDKMASFYLPVFYHQQISKERRRGQPPYPTLKWVDSQQVLSCSSGLKIELFSLKRVFNLEEDPEQIEAVCKRDSSLDLNDSLTLIFAQAPGAKNSGMSETDKESDDYPRVRITPLPLPSDGRTRLDGHEISSSTPSATADDELEVMSGSGRRAPINYVSVEDDEIDIFGDATATSNNSLGKELVSTGENCEEGAEEESSAQPVSRSDYQGGSSADGSWNKGRMMMMMESQSTTDSAESAPEADTNTTSRSQLLESDDGLQFPSPRGCHSLPGLDSTQKKKSQVYMADDELSDGPATGSVAEIRKEWRWPIHAQQPGHFLKPLMPPPIIPPPPSSIAAFTTVTTTVVTTADTYSPPFTCQSLPPTSGTEDDDDDATVVEKLEDEKSEVTGTQEEKTEGDEEKTSQSEKEESKIETEAEEDDPTELELSDMTQSTTARKDESPTPSAPRLEEQSELDTNLEAVEEVAQDTETEVVVSSCPVSANSAEPDVQEELNQNQRELEVEVKILEKEDENVEQSVGKVKELPPSQSSSLTQSSQTQTPVSNKDEHGTQTMRLSSSSSSGRVSEEEHHVEAGAAGVPVPSKKRCRPYCVITTPPPPSKINSGTKASIARFIRTLGIGSSGQLEFNNAADDQMPYKTILVPGVISERLRKQAKRSKKVTLKEEKEEQDNNENKQQQQLERNISLSKLTEKVCQKIVDETTSSTTSAGVRPCASQLIWEQAAKHFQQKVSRLLEQKRRRKSTTDVNQEGFLDGRGTGALDGVKESRSVPAANTISEDAQERLKSILKSGTQKKSKIVKSLLWLRDAEPAVEQFQGKTLPHDATNNLELVEELKRRLQMLKYHQEQSKSGGGNRELTRFMSSWSLGSESVLPSLNLEEMMMPQPTVFPLLVDQPQVKLEGDQPSPASSLAADPRQASTTPPPHQKNIPASKSQPTMRSGVTTSSFIIDGTSNGVKRNKSHHIFMSKKSILKVAVPPPPPPVPPHSPKRRGRKPQQRQYIIPSIRVPTFTIGPPPKSKHSLVGKATKKASTLKPKVASGGRRSPAAVRKTSSKSTISKRSSHHFFIKAQPGKTKISKDKSPIRVISRVKHGVTSTTSAVVRKDSPRREMGLAEKSSIKKIDFIPTSPSSRIFRNNLRKLSVINSKLDAQASGSRRGERGRSPTPPPPAQRRNFTKTGSTTTLFRKGHGDKREKLSLKILPEAFEQVPVGKRQQQSSKRGVGVASVARGKNVEVPTGFELSDAERDKLARRVSFSDPIAIVKTVSPMDLNENAAGSADRHRLHNISMVIGPGRNSPRNETRAQFNMN